MTVGKKTVNYPDIGVKGVDPLAGRGSASMISEPAAPDPVGIPAPKAPDPQGVLFDKRR